ncbi:toll-like receptor 3 [Esox lucius]|uniref:TIR domain-containing protein n=1 Tax=Esox lucius TaxID=8010 RepID=A0A3P9AIV7_ESOLU|nr:toll-like receptor 3 [Esox lucius]
MNWPALITVLLALNLGDLIFGPSLCNASPKFQKNACRIRRDVADCRHLKLEEIPPDLPGNITGLDVSHNRLGALSSVSLAPYPGLVRLDLGFNNLKKLEESLCQTLPLLRTLNVQHNQVHQLMEKDFSHCLNLTELNLAGNRLKLHGESFAALQSVTLLDLSNNDLKTAKLGIQPQLSSLETLILSSNAISTIELNDFNFLTNSSSLRVLNLSYQKTHITFKSGCLKPIAGIHELVMDGNKLSTALTSKLCTELSGTAIRNISLRYTGLVTLAKTTFKGLVKTQLISLDLSHNGMTKIDNGSFQWLPVLEVLSLEQNNLKRLTSNTFKGLGNLTRLNLKNALLKTSSNPIIDDFSFQPLRALEILIMQYTAFRDISTHTFAGLISLRQLHLGSAKCIALKRITNQTFVSLAASPLQTLNLSDTKISSLDPGAFYSLGNLTILRLGFNSISQTLTGKEFQGLGKLQEIYLSNNNQKITLSPTSFAYVPTLITLLMGKVLIGSLDLEPSPFKPLSNLSILDLSNNNIAKISRGIFDGLENLKVLKLQHNNLAQAWTSFNPRGPVMFLKGLCNLVALEMDSNGLDEIPLEALRGLPNLQELSLSGNVLKHFKDSVFDHLSSLRVLRLQKNEITSVRKEVFGAVLANLSQLVMNTNPFDCTCDSILWFATWLNRTNASVPGLRDEYICNTPLSYYNHSVLEFDPLSCQDMTPFQALYVLTTTAVLILMVTSFLVRFHGWRIQFYWNVLINRTLGFSDTNSREGRAFEYDAYVVHAADDTNWVERSLLPLEDNQGYSFYLQERDAVPGNAHLDSIAENMKKSRKIILVVTEKLLNDPFCRHFTAHQARHQVIEDSRDAVVLVFLEDVHDYRLFRHLRLRRDMLRQRCVVSWPVQRERVPAFHQSLCIALGTTSRVQ